MYLSITPIINSLNRKNPQHAAFNGCKNGTSTVGKFTFIDLINYPTSNLENLYLKCDGHWSPLGNKWAAEIISNKLIRN